MKICLDVIATDFDLFHCHLEETLSLLVCLLKNLCGILRHILG